MDLNLNDETAGDGFAFGQEKRRDLANGYVDELLEALDWLIAKSQGQTLIGEQEPGIDGETKS